MGARYNINGQEFTEEEFRKFQEENGFFNFGNFGQRRQKRWDHKLHLYQCYKNTVPDRWLEISLDDFEYDYHKKPKFLKNIYYVQTINNQYNIVESPVVAVFYDHFNDVFLYMKADGIIKESNCFSSDEDALKAVQQLENKKSGKTILFSANGEFIKECEMSTSYLVNKDDNEVNDSSIVD
jgi:hypothetical protein